MNRHLAATLIAAIILSALPVSVLAQIDTTGVLNWTGSGDGVNWSDNANWSSSFSSGNGARFTAAGNNTVNAAFLGGSPSIQTVEYNNPSGQVVTTLSTPLTIKSNYQLVAGDNSSGNGKVSGGSLTLNSNAGIVVGYNGGSVGTPITATLALDGVSLTSTSLGGFIVGRNERNNNDPNKSVTATLDLTNATGNLNIQSQVQVGYKTDATGTVSLGSGHGVSIGSGGAVGFLVGTTAGNNGALASGTLSKAGGSFTANLNDVQVGVNDNGGGNTAYGFVDLSAVTSGSWAVAGGSTMRIGTKRDSAGTLKLGATTDTIGVFNSSRASLLIGHTEGNGGNPTTYSNGTLTKSGGSFEAYLTQWDVGRNSNGSGVNDTASGTMDLTGATLTSNGIDSSATLNVGYGRSATGTVKLPIGNVTAPNIQIGGTDSSGTGTGLLELHSTIFKITSIATISNTGTVDTFIKDYAGGLSLTNTSSGVLALNSGHTNGLELSFANPISPGLISATNPYWGFRWAYSGTDHIAALTALLNATGSSYTGGTGAITASVTGSLLNISDLTIGNYTESGTNYTFIGFIHTVPEPGSLALFVVGMAGLMRIVRKHRNAL